MAKSDSVAAKVDSRDAASDLLLLVQRDDQYRADFVDSLESLGYRIIVCDDTESCQLEFDRQAPDIVLLDINLPNGSGHQLLRDFSADKREVPIIVLSRRKLMSDVVEALRHGACDYLILPLDDKQPELLQGALDRARQQGGLRRENQDYRQKLEATNRDLHESLNHLQKDQQAGRHIQVKMLPPTPKIIGNYRFCQHILPSLYLSGDFIDYFSVGDHHAVFFVADVSGHGASSAFVTVMLKNLFARKRSDYSHRHDSAIMSPARMLERANRELLDMEIEKYVTMCVGLLELGSGDLSYCIAGHLPAPVVSVDGQARYLEGGDLPVGLFADVQYREHQVNLPDNAVLTLFSDGILEVLKPDGLLAKEQALLESLKPGQRATEQIVETFNLTQVKDAPDDIAILVVARV